jgi:hypothetical protein
MRAVKGEKPAVNRWNSTADTATLRVTEARSLL